MSMQTFPHHRLGRVCTGGHPLSAPHRMGGLTLVELMIAIGLGLFITSAVVVLLVGTRTSYFDLRRDSQILSVTRVALTAISDDINLAGVYADFNAADLNHLVDIQSGLDVTSLGNPQIIYAKNGVGTTSTDVIHPPFVLHLASKIVGAKADDTNDALGQAFGTMKTLIDGNDISGHWRSDTDILSLRYAHPQPRFDVDLLDELLYINATVGRAVITRKGSLPPALPSGLFYLLDTIVYVVSDEPGTPASTGLRRFSLNGAGGSLAFRDDLVAEGVSDLEIWFGVDDCHGNAYNKGLLPACTSAGETRRITRYLDVDGIRVEDESPTTQGDYPASLTAVQMRNIERTMHSTRSVRVQLEVTISDVTKKFVTVYYLPYLANLN